MHPDQPIFRPAKGELPRDRAFILDMLVPLTTRQARARHRKLGYGAFPDELETCVKEGYGLFTCRHWDTETRLCTVYDQRPDMCRDYPYRGRSCARGGCEYATDQAHEDQKADRDDSCWVYDTEAKGWRPRSNSTHRWDGRRRILLAVEPS